MPFQHCEACILIESSVDFELEGRQNFADHFVGRTSDAAVHEELEQEWVEAKQLGYHSHASILILNVGGMVCSLTQRTGPSCAQVFRAS